MTTETTQCRFCGTFQGSEHHCASRELPAAPRASLEPLTETGTRKPPRDLGDPERDLEMLARHLPTILGSALDPEPRVASGRILDGRQDFVDLTHHDLAQAIDVMRRLASMDWKPRLVLVYAYLLCGVEARQRSAGFATRLGLVFATARQRLAWLTHQAKSMGMSAASRLGETLLKDAVQAYAAIAGELPKDDGRWMSTAIDQVTRMDLLASSDIRTLVRTREINRCNPVGQNRASRRDAKKSRPTTNSGNE